MGQARLEARHAVPAIEAAGVSVDYDKAVVARAMALAHKFAARESASIVFVPLSVARPHAVALCRLAGPGV
jgi:hypothetical protein